MRKDQAYFDNPAIGSSLLGTFTEDSPDHALMEVKPTTPMENGRVWEDLVEHYLSEGKNGFNDKYFLSSVSDFPNPKKVPSIPELMDSKDVKKTVKSAYVWNKGKKVLNQTYANYHNLLDEIQANGYKRPIPKGCWDKMDRMWSNFRKATWRSNNIVDMLMGLDTVKFQTEHYWEDIECGAECRMKSDIEAVYETSEGKQGLLIDLKFTGGIKQFTTRFIKTRWQDRHYSTGYGQYCRRNDIEPPLSMLYIICDSSAPYLTYVREMQPMDAMALQSEYSENLAECWSWIKGGKKAIGFKEQSINKYGRPVK